MSSDEHENASRARKGRRGRKRAPATILTEAETQHAKKRIRSTTKASLRDNTRTMYKSYMRGIDEWYSLNHPELCNGNGQVDDERMNELCNDPETCGEMAEIFKTFIMTRKHATDKNEDGTPAIARTGSLSGYRSSWSHFVFTSSETQEQHIPLEWDARMVKLFSGLKNEEAARKQAGLGGGKLQEGKSKMTVQLYMKVGDYFLEEGKVEAQFFHTWMWNLMCRSMNVFEVTAKALGWAGDCISVEFGVDKVRKDGGNNKSAMVKHLFANPFRPSVSFRCVRHLCQFKFYAKFYAIVYLRQILRQILLQFKFLRQILRQCTFTPNFTPYMYVTYTGLSYDFPRNAGFRQTNFRFSKGRQIAYQKQFQ